MLPQPSKCWGGGQLASKDEESAALQLSRAQSPFPLTTVLPAGDMKGLC